MASPSLPSDPPLQSIIESADQEHQAATSTLSTVESNLDAVKRQIHELVSELRQKELDAQRYAQILPNAQRAKVHADKRLKELKQTAQRMSKELAAERRLQEYWEELKRADEDGEKKLEGYLGELYRRDVEGFGDSDSESEWSVLDAGETSDILRPSPPSAALPSRRLDHLQNYSALTTTDIEPPVDDSVIKAISATPRDISPKTVIVTDSLPSEIIERPQAPAIGNPPVDAEKVALSPAPSGEYEVDSVSQKVALPQENEIPIMLSATQHSSDLQVLPGLTSQQHAAQNLEEVESVNDTHTASVSRSPTPTIRRSPSLRSAISRPPTPPPKEVIVTQTEVVGPLPAEEIPEGNKAETTSLHGGVDEIVAGSSSTTLSDADVVLKPRSSLPSSPGSPRSPRNVPQGYPPNTVRCHSPMSEINAGFRILNEPMGRVAPNSFPSTSTLVGPLSAAHTLNTEYASRSKHGHSRSADGVPPLKIEKISVDRIPREANIIDAHGRAAARGSLTYPRVLPQPPIGCSASKQGYPPIPFESRAFSCKAGLSSLDEGWRHGPHVSPTKMSEVRQKVERWQATTDDGALQQSDLRSPSRSSQRSSVGLYYPKPSHLYEATPQFLTGQRKAPMPSDIL